MTHYQDWKIVFESLQSATDPCFWTRESGRKGIPDAGLNLAIDDLFEHTDFNKVSRKLYRQRLDGILKLKQEEKLRGLGVKI